jgi:hypothetical protein
MDVSKRKIELKNKEYEKKNEQNRTTTKLKTDVDIFNEIRTKVPVSEIMLKFIPERPLKKD